MNRSTAVLTILVAAFAPVVVWIAVGPFGVAAGLEDPTAEENGDVNGDGDLNVADPVYLLLYLFSGGEEPVPIAAPTPELPATGQTQCFDCSGHEIDCSSASYPGQDAVYRTGCPSEERFVDAGDGTVIDLCTGLQWAKAAADADADGTAETMRWCAGLRYCEELELSGHPDWRMPNAQELQSILDYASEQGTMPAVLDGPLGPYWSSSTQRTDILKAWVADFSADGGVHTRTKLVEFSHTRAVRNADL